MRHGLRMTGAQRVLRDDEDNQKIVFTSIFWISLVVMTELWFVFGIKNDLTSEYIWRCLVVEVDNNGDGVEYNSKLYYKLKSFYS